MKRFHEYLKRLLSKPKAGKIFIGLGMVGVILIFLSDYFPVENDQKSELPEFDSYTAYAQYLEKELAEILSKIYGAGKTEVFISLEASGEYIYAYDQTQTEEKRETGSEYEIQTHHEKNHVIKNTSDQVEEPITVAQLAPNINGVLIVCDGGDDPSVQKDVRNAICSALAVAESKVYVTKRN